MLERVLAGIEEVIYCIGGLQPAAAERDPELDAALLLKPLRNLVAALADRPGTTLTYLSSGGAVYGNPDQLPVTEDALPKPIGAYAAVRLAGERILCRAHQRYQLAVRILRCANVYGEHQPVDRGQGAVAVFLDRISRGQPIEVFGDGDIVRDYVYVADLVEVIARLLGRRGGLTVLNVGSGSGTSVNELIGLLEAAVGRDAVVLPRPGRGFDVRRVVLDITRMRRLLAVDPLMLSEGITRLVAQPEPRRVSAAPASLVLAS